MTKAHSLSIVARGINTTHQTLVITKEEDGDTSYHADGIEKALLVEPVGQVKFVEPLCESKHVENRGALCSALGVRRILVVLDEG